MKDWFSSIQEKLDKSDVLSRRQQAGFRAFELCLYDKDNVLYLNSDGMKKRYIVSKAYMLGRDVSTFIILESDVTDNNVTIVNHHYSYDVPMPRKTFNKMTEMFDKKIREDREKMEQEILSNITRSLEMVVADLEERLCNK